MIEKVFIALMIIIGVPLLSYLIVKYGVVGYFRAKQFIEKENIERTNGNGKEKG